MFPPFGLYPRYNKSISHLHSSFNTHLEYGSIDYKHYVWVNHSYVLVILYFLTVIIVEPSHPGWIIWIYYRVGYQLEWYDQYIRLKCFTEWYITHLHLSSSKVASDITLVCLSWYVNNHFNVSMNCDFLIVIVYTTANII